MTEQGTWRKPEDRNKHHKWSEITEQFAEGEILSLLDFAKSKLPLATNEESESSQVYDLYNRPDAWDDSGVINKIQNIFRDHIKATNFLVGILEPKRFALIRTDELQSYSEQYAEFNGESEVEYTCVVTLNSNFRGGDTVYTKTGEGIGGEAGKFLAHRNEEMNSWKIKDVNVGTRYDFMMVVLERPVSARYDEFEIEMTIDDGSWF